MTENELLSSLNAKMCAMKQNMLFLEKEINDIQHKIMECNQCVIAKVRTKHKSTLKTKKSDESDFAKKNKKKNKQKKQKRCLKKWKTLVC